MLHRILVYVFVAFALAIAVSVILMLIFASPDDDRACRASCTVSHLEFFEQRTAVRAGGLPECWCSAPDGHTLVRVRGVR